MTKTKTYIGDSVYAEFDGHGINLTTENGLPNDPSNQIYLEPRVYQELFCFALSLERKEYDNTPDREQIQTGEQKGTESGDVHNASIR